jgi:hypothetical protein
LNYRKSISLLAGIISATSFAQDITPSHGNVWLQQQTGLFSFNYDDIKMPAKIPRMGLLGMNYFANITPVLYGGIGAYGSVTGTQGGLFVLGFGGGLHKEIVKNLWGDVGFFAGGGGGKASLVGGGLMLRPHIGLSYAWQPVRLGLHYSYITFPSGQIQSSQVGLDFAIPFDFHYISPPYRENTLLKLDDILIPCRKFLDFQHLDFALIMQAYYQHPGTRGVNGALQDGTIKLIGAELDQYFKNHFFWSLKAAGAYSGIPNGYMDVLGSLGYRWSLRYGFAIIPQIGAGAGGGGNVDTGGGILIQPQLGLEVPISSDFAFRLSSGYLWSPKGEMNAYMTTGALIYHLNIATARTQPSWDMFNSLKLQAWRFQIFNQTYLRPQRARNSKTSAINQIAMQMDQFFSPYFFFCYQAAAAYSGYQAGGLATGMIGPGIQSPAFQHLKLFGQLLVGAGGGGGLGLGGGALIEPVLGLHYSFTPAMGLQVSYSQVKAIHNNLNTPVLNLGLSVNFGTLNRKD